MLFRHKYHANGTLSRYKARHVANGSTQLEGIDVDETFSLVVKLSTIQTVLSLATSRHWPIYQLDIKNAFLHGDLSETVYMHQPPGFRDSVHPDYVCLLQRSLYGLKQAPRAWFQRFASYITRVGFHHKILERAGMVSCNSNRMPVNTKSKLGNEVQQVCLYMHDPRKRHLSDLKRVLRYVRGTLDYGLQLFSSSTTDLVAYSDADWAEAEYHGVANVVRVLHVSSRYQYADIFTKGLPSAMFEEFRTSLSVQSPPAPTAEVLAHVSQSNLC
ncbi:ribonuclease H-like domain-containing protein [Tanacetum coccineum]|uniref:Ribonuclease H-like domain-containing protein n=1 Tax=Tanacetum coccineum TaxID=301880 RepID=A0ABQ5IN04_9ASTR